MSELPLLIESPPSTTGRCASGQAPAKLHVLFVSDVYFPRINGVSTSIETFRGELMAAGHRVSLIAPHYQNVKEVIRAAAGIYRIPARAVPRDPEDRLMSYRSALGLAEALRPQNVAVVHIHTPFVAHYAGLALARALGVPCVATYHTYFEEYLGHYLPFLPGAWVRAAARRFSRAQCNDLDAVVVPSAAMREVLAGYGVSRPLTVLPTGIPTDFFSPGDGRRFRGEHGIAAERPMALFVGRVAFEKNIGFLLEVVARARRLVPGLLLVVAGEGPALPALREQTEHLGLAGHVLFVGYLDRHSGLRDCYAAADAFVFASRTETQGLVLLEAMAQGVPVVGLAMMGTREIILPQRGAVAAPDDVAGFARCLVDVLHEPSRRAALALDAQQFARQWSAAARARELAELYQSLLET